MAILKPYSYNGTSLQSTDYDTTFPRSNGIAQLQTNVNYIKRAGAVPIISGKDYGTAMLNLDILCLHDTFDLLENINRLFDTKDETPRQFIATDEQDSSKQYFVYATPRQVNGGGDGNRVSVMLAIDDPIWQSVTQFSDTDTFSASSDSITVNVGGNDYAYPLFEITPTTIASTDFVYSAYLQVIPTSTDAYPNRPLYLRPSTDTWDTSALVLDGKMQSAGQDIRVLRDGVNIDFQIIDINTTDTSLLVNADMPESIQIPLLEAIPSGAITSITLTHDVTNNVLLDKMPATGRVVVCTALGSSDTEEFTYTAKTKNATAKKNYLTISARAVRDTVDVIHAKGSKVYWLPSDYTILYGSPSAEAVTIDEARKPIISSSDSSNSSFVYRQFYDLAGLRSGIFKPQVLKTTKPTLTRSETFTSTDDGGDVDPAEALGISAYSYQELGVWKADTVEINWIGYFPDKIASVSADGQQYQNIAARPVVTFRGAALATPTKYAVLSTIAPSTDLTQWTAWSKASTDFTVVAGANTYLLFSMVGSLSSTTDNFGKVSVDNLTVGLQNVPHVMFRAEKNNYKLDCRITNVNTGEYMDVTYPMTVGKTLTIDTDPNFPKAVYDGLTINSAVQPDAIRSAWLPLIPAVANEIDFVSNVGGSNINFVIKWRDRLNQF